MQRKKSEASEGTGDGTEEQQQQQQEKKWTLDNEEEDEEGTPVVETQKLELITLEVQICD